MHTYYISLKKYKELDVITLIQITCAVHARILHNNIHKS